MHGSGLGVYVLWREGGCCKTNPSASSSQSRRLHRGINHGELALSLGALVHERKIVISGGSSDQLSPAQNGRSGTLQKTWSRRRAAEMGVNIPGACCINFVIS